MVSSTDAGRKLQKRSKCRNEERQGGPARINCAGDTLMSKPDRRRLHMGPGGRSWGGSWRELEETAWEWYRYRTRKACSSPCSTAPTSAMRKPAYGTSEREAGRAFLESGPNIGEGTTTDCSLQRKGESGPRQFDQETRRSSRPGRRHDAGKYIMLRTSSMETNARGVQILGQGTIRALPTKINLDDKGRKRPASLASRATQQNPSQPMAPRAHDTIHRTDSSSKPQMKCFQKRINPRRPAQGRERGIQATLNFPTLKLQLEVLKIVQIFHVSWRRRRSGGSMMGIVIRGYPVASL